MIRARVQHADYVCSRDKSLTVLDPDGCESNPVEWVLSNQLSSMHGMKEGPSHLEALVNGRARKFATD